MDTKGVLEILEKTAPLSLSYEMCKKYSMYDNSGILINCGGETKGALFCLDLNENAAAEAKRLGYNLIVTHHPVIYGGISRLDTVDDPMARAYAECIKNGISVISMHLNMDCAPEGIDYYLMRGIGGVSPVLCCTLAGGGYGRCYQIEEISFSDLVAHIGKEFKTERVITYGGERAVKNVASFCGAGCDDETLAFAAENGADVFVSSDMKHHQICYLVQRGINVVILTHYASEVYGFNKIYNKISAGLPFPSAFFAERDYR